MAESSERPARMTCAHHSHYTGALVQDLLREGGHGPQGVYLALLQLIGHVFHALLRVDEGYLEMEVVLPGNLLHNLSHPLQMGVSSCTAAGAYDYRNLAVMACDEHILQVPLGRISPYESLPHAQIVGARVGAASVAGDEVETTFYCPLEGLIPVPITQDARCRV